jgi:serine/threonine protein kinase
MIGTQISQYRLIEKLGEGGMGVVYKGVDVLLDRVVAVKLVSSELAANPELLERFKSEAKVQATLSHPNIATLYSYLIWEGRAVMVMEFIEGETLQQMIARRGPIPSDVAIPLFKQALLGVGAAHRRGIVHRDIKPANIMVNGEGLIKVMDFGIAKVLGATGTTRTNLQMGTVWYMAPEQVLNRPVDARTDIYALGVTLYEILSGQVPFRANSEYEVLTAHVQKVPELPTQHYPHIPRSCVEAVMRALSKEPERRFASTEEFSLALDQPSTGGVDLPPRPQPFDAPPVSEIKSRVSSVHQVTVPKEVSFAEAVESGEPAGKKKASWLPLAIAAVVLIVVGVGAWVFFAMRERQKQVEIEAAERQTSTTGNQRVVALATDDEDRRQQAELDRSKQELKEQLAQEQSQPPANRPQQQVAAAGGSVPRQPGQSIRNPADPGKSLAPREDEPARLRMLSGTWSGTYICSQGVTGVTLQIVASSDQNIGALLQFAVPNSRPGSYFMRGVFDPSNNRIAMKFTNWKYQPEGAVPADITGTVNFRSSELRGTILQQGCANLSMRKQ